MNSNPLAILFARCEPISEPYPARARVAASLVEAGKDGTDAAAVAILMQARHVPPLSELPDAERNALPAAALLAWTVIERLGRHDAEELLFIAYHDILTAQMQKGREFSGYKPADIIEAARTLI